MSVRNRAVAGIALFAVAVFAAFVYYWRTIPSEPQAKDEVDHTASELSTNAITPQHTPAGFEDKRATQSNEPGRIQGTVYHINGMRATGLDVAAFQADSSWMAGGTTASAVYMCSTDDNGKFVLEHLPLGEYLVTSGTDDAKGTERVGLSARRPVGEITLILYSGGTISGNVKSSTGVPVIGARVIPFMHDGRGTRPYIREAFSANSDANGVFRLSGLETGPWALNIVAEGFAQLETKEVPTGTENLEIILEPGLPLEGITIHALTGQPVGNVTVTISKDDSDATPARAESDDEGRFHFPNLAVAPHTLDIDHTDYILADGPKRVNVFAQAPAVELSITPGGAIMGRLLDAGTMSGVEGVIVTAQPGERTNASPFSAAPAAVAAGTGGVRPANVESRARRAKATNSDGSFEIAGLAPGSWRLSVSGRIPGFASSLVNETSVVVQVSPGETIEGVEMLLDRGVTLEGIVVDVAGNPVADAQLLLQGEISGTGADTQTSTDVRGHFALSALKPDQEVTLAASSLTASSKPFGPVYVSSEGVKDIRLVLDVIRDGIIAGKVVTRDAKPLKARIMATNDVMPYPYKPSIDETDSFGQFMLANVAAGTYTLFVTPEGGKQKPSASVTIASGQTVQDLRIVYEAEALLAITGRITDQDGNPIRASIQCLRMEGDRMSGNTSVQSRDDGTFEAKNLEPGTYALWPRAAGYEGAPVEAEAGATGVELVMESSAGLLTGRVIDTAHQPVAKFRIAVLGRNRPGSDQPLPESEFKWVNHPEGKVEIPLSPGSYTVEVRAEGFLSSRMDSVGVENGAPTEITITLKPGDAVVTGIVVNAAGQPVSGASVYKGALPERVESRPDLASAKSGGDGRFELKGVEVDKPLAVSAYHARSGAGTASVTPRANVAQEVRIVLAALGTIQGTVTRGGQPASPLRIAISQGGIESASAFTNNDGAYTVNALPAGLYDVTVQLPPAQPGEPPAQHTRQAEVAGDAVTTVDFVLD